MTTPPWLKRQAARQEQTPQPSSLQKNTVAPDEFAELDEQPEPLPFDEAGFAQMRRDFCEVEREWCAAVRKRPSLDKVVYGPAKTCPTCSGTAWWRSAATPGPWSCRTCEPPNAYRKDVMFRFAGR
jgi:hypothetical protein